MMTDAEKGNKAADKYEAGHIRMATLEDAAEIYAIYEPYILKTTVTFEYDRLPVEVFQKRMSDVMEKFPWLVYEVNGEILGYAYASSFHTRAAYAWDCELSIYLKEDSRARGIGTALYTKLLEILERQGYYQAYALISVPNPDSMKFHEKFGFTLDGVHKKTGYKFRRWIDLALLSKCLRECEGEPEKVKTVWEVIEEGYEI